MKNNENGAILITVAVLTLVMMILVVSVISLNVSQIKTNRHQAQRIKAEQIAKQIFWQNYSSLSLTGSPLNPLTGIINIPINGGPSTEAYEYTITPTPGAGPGGTDVYAVDVQYPGQ
ncbi:MAG TPA: hypothetical protein PL155_07505 [Candidatus Omnitrophota bacterium]|nr:hypothetical protein [Candidatus Omnitrophota bacterium]HPD85320.1 hypothetical protein [Candidatus Omnitrophota bacterium]HRZ04179.1 hypothetical protein [Candidatus Omnitrophota bacterium]